MLCTCLHELSQHNHPGDGRCDYSGHSCSCTGFNSSKDALAKPAPRGRRPRRAIPRGARPRSRVGNRWGDHRAKVHYANDLWREIIYAKELEGVCPRCRKRSWHDAAHGFVKGRHFHLRFDLDNGIPLCRSCHGIVDSDHQAKVELWIRYYGVERYDALLLRSQSRSKIDMTLVILHLEATTASERERVQKLGYTWPVRPPGARKESL